MFPDEKQRTFAIGVGSQVTQSEVLSGLWLEARCCSLSMAVRFLGKCSRDGFIADHSTILIAGIQGSGCRETRSLSAGQSIVAILSVIFGLKKIAEDGITAGASISILIGVLFIFLFIRRQNKLESPLIELRLFRIPTFSVSLLAYMTSAFVSFGGSVFLAQYLQLVLGLSPLRRTVMRPWTSASLLVSLLTPGLSCM